MARRLCTSLLVALAVVAAVGLLGRGRAHRLPAAAAPAAAELPAEEDRGEAARAVCSGKGRTPVTSANVNLIVDDGFAYQSGTSCAAPQNEPSLAVNPVDPQNLVGGANDFRLCCGPAGENSANGWVYYSKDGGATWTNVQLPGLTRKTGGTGEFRRFDMAEDPAIAFGPDGTVYDTHIVFDGRSPASGIALSTSKDGGASWSPPQLLQYTNDPALFNDKSWVTVGAGGEIAVTWTKFHSDGFVGTSYVEGSISRDGGASWRRVRLSGASHVRSWGAMPLWAKDGTLYTVFETSRAADDSRNAIAVSLYRPGQRLVERTLGRVFDGANCFAVNGHLRQTLSDEAFRVSSLPAASLDPDSQTVAVVWADGQRGCKPGRFSGLTDAQVKLVFVHGTHSSKPRIVTSGADKALPAVAYRSGKVVIGYYTRSFAPADCLHNEKRVCLDYAYSTSSDGFREEHRLSDSSSNPFEQFDGAFIGDYSALVLGADGSGHALWTDSRGGDQNIFTQSFAP